MLAFEKAFFSYVLLLYHSRKDINFRFPFPRRLHIKFGFDWPSSFRGDVSTMWTDGRCWTPEHGYTISSPCEPEGSGEGIKIVHRQDNSPTRFLR